MDMVKISKGLVVQEGFLTKEAEYSFGRERLISGELQISASPGVLGHFGWLPWWGDLWWGHVPVLDPRWRAGPSSAREEGRSKDERRQEHQSDHF